MPIPLLSFGTSDHHPKPQQIPLLTRQNSYCNSHTSHLTTSSSFSPTTHRMLLQSLTSSFSTGAQLSPVWFCCKLARFETDLTYYKLTCVCGVNPMQRCNAYAQTSSAVLGGWSLSRCSTALLQAIPLALYAMFVRFEFPLWHAMLLFTINVWGVVFCGYEQWEESLRNPPCSQQVNILHPREIRIINHQIGKCGFFSPFFWVYTEIAPAFATHASILPSLSFTASINP
ncbi:hypothetical protein GQ43DRAFT_11384 [Delitschia confertaspora ATCC 74209]|uniref:Uncharacterized protein n=1 Tax=Delitschia confertaspora ATCC 74209 TaxID=1513339 RepID=A0A9P4JMZ1_9PLEO|nr:hypothetical protein GQ43DRAFT_11384 [Delitschia confertaspora ATCC 74209]